MEIQKQQKLQYEHDLKNHFDVLSLSRIDRLKHYGLHFAKYAGRFARGSAEKKTRQQTVVDAFLVSLSAANALNQRLNASPAGNRVPDDLQFTDYSGRFADACEKVDHLEEFRDIALEANAGIFSWLLSYVDHQGLDIERLIADRRQQLASRAVYAQD